MTTIYESNIVDKLYELGKQPFIMVFMERDGAECSYCICEHQNDAGNFVGEIAALPEFAGSRLLRALERGLQLDILTAATLLFDWIGGDGAVAETAYVGFGDGLKSPMFEGYPAFAVGVRGPDDSGSRAALLGAILDGYASANGNAALRPALIESFSFALTRWFGAAGEYGRAAQVLAPGLAANPSSPFLRAADRALRARQAGSVMPRGLAKFAGEDDGHFAIAAKIRDDKVQPFLMVRTGLREPAYVVCPDQNEVPAFLDALSRIPGFGGSLLLRGIHRALRFEPLDAAALLFSWVRSGSALGETAFVDLGDEPGLPSVVEYPAYGLAAPTPSTRQERAALLADAFDRYVDTGGNDSLRLALIEAFALALSRAFGSTGDYAEAGRIVGVAVATCPHSPYLPAAQAALAARLAGHGVRSGAFIGDDDAHFDVIAKVRDLGSQPFVLVHGAAPDPGFTVCPSQNDAPAFCAALGRIPGFTESLLLRGIERALRFEALEAAGLLLAWVNGTGTVAETIFVEPGGGPDGTRLVEFPAYGIGAAAPVSRRERIALLIAAFDQYIGAQGNDGLRVALVEAVALALSRALGDTSEYLEAVRVVGVAAAACPDSKYLAAAQAGLAAKTSGDVSRFAGFIGADEAHLTAIAKVLGLGFQPFMLVRSGHDRADVVCANQNEAPAFVEALRQLPSYSESFLLRGVERALQLEIFDAADLLFCWVKGADGPDETVFIEPDADLPIAAFCEYPVFGASNRAPATYEARADLLATALQQYARAQGNDALRFALIESLAFALSRALGKVGQYARAAQIVGVGLGVRPYSIHLKAAQHALELKLTGLEVPGRLAKFIGDDDGYLKKFICQEPFKRFDIGPSGEVLVCCGHWLPTNIGDFLNQPVADILNSPKALQIRQSVTDGTYKYCNHLECGTMIQGLLPTAEELEPGPARRALDQADYRVDSVDNVLFAFDQTCNLSCPSCRRSRIIERVSDSDAKAAAVEQKLLPLLPSLKVLNLNPAGELFSSKPSRKLLELINDERCPQLSIDIISNGTLFSEQEWNKFPGIHNKVRSIRISVDAARAETFEKLRRLGKHDVFVENMRFLSRLRSRNIVPELKFSFTYQRDNFREMPEFVAFCREMHCDFVIFERLQNLGAFTDAEYRERAVHHASHPLYEAFIEVIKDPTFRAREVWHDFDYPGVANMSREDAWDRVRELAEARGSQAPEVSGAD